jgi:transposase
MGAAGPNTTPACRTKSARRADSWAEAVFQKIDGEAGDSPDLLDLPGLRTVRFKKTPHDVVIQAQMTATPPIRCPACGGFLFIRNGAPTYFVKDQPILNRRARIFFRWQRYLCQVCRHSWQQPLPGVDTRSGMTRRLVTFIEQESMRMQSFARVAEAAGVSAHTVRGVFADLTLRLEESVGAAREFPRRVGLDECYIDGVARFVITDLDRRRTFEILPKKDALTITRYLIQAPHPERVAVVVIDMWKPYRDLVRRFLPRAVIVVDKFHVLKKANDAVMAVRRRVRDRLPPSRREKCMKHSSERKGKGKRSRFLLLKRAQAEREGGEDAQGVEGGVPGDRGRLRPQGRVLRHLGAARPGRGRETVRRMGTKGPHEPARPPARLPRPTARGRELAGGGLQLLRPALYERAD